MNFDKILNNRMSQPEMVEKLMTKKRPHFRFLRIFTQCLMVISFFFAFRKSDFDYNNRKKNIELIKTHLYAVYTNTCWLVYDLQSKIGEIKFKRILLILFAVELISKVNLAVICVQMGSINLALKRLMCHFSVLSCLCVLVQCSRPNPMNVIDLTCFSYLFPM